MGFEWVPFLASQLFYEDALAIPITQWRNHAKIDDDLGVRQDYESRRRKSPKVRQISKCTVITAQWKAR